MKFTGTVDVLTETVVANDLPNSFEAFYEHSHMDNTLETTFTALDGSRTRYDIEGEYTALRGFGAQSDGTDLPGSFHQASSEVARQLQGVRRVTG